MTFASQDFAVRFTPGRVDAGIIGGGTLIQIGSSGLLGAPGDINGMTMLDPTDGRSKVFAVSGTGDIICTINVEEDQVTGGSIEGWASRVATLGVGEFPATNKLVVPWLGRAVLARPTVDSQNYFMSRNGNALDWLYTADPQATTPILGRNSKAGVPGDSITALMVTWDDVLMFGCASSIWAMNGDPSFGGRVDIVSAKTGVLGPEAFAFDSKGNLYVLGTSGFFGIARGSMDPQDIGRSRLNNTFREIDLRTTLAQMTFDPVSDRIHIYLTPITEPGSAPDHWIYDTRNNALWRWQYPIKAGPTASCEPTSAAPEERRPLIGGFDGVIRRHDKGTLSDFGDGIVDPITSFLRFAAIEAEDAALQIMLNELQATGSTSSGVLNWRVYSGNSREDIAQIAFGATPDASGQWFVNGGGFQQPAGVRVAQGAVMLEIFEVSSNATWALERIVGTVMPLGRRRV